MLFIVSEQHFDYNISMITCTFEDGGKGLLRHVVVDCIVRKDNKILLVKRAAHLDNGGKYALVGGFMSRDETVEETVSREIFEETGYQSSVAFLLRIIDNPNRRNEDRQNVSFVFVVDAGLKTGQADNESTEVRWFDIDKLPPQEQFAFDHLESVNCYLDYVKQPFPLPLFGKKSIKK